jgi:hypothetical protein
MFLCDRISIRSKEKFFLFAITSTSEPPPVSYQMGKGGSFAGGKAAGACSFSLP